MSRKQKKPSSKAKFTTICSKDKLKEIRSFVAMQIEKIKLDEKAKHQIVLAVDEAAANAIIHGNLCDENKKIHVEIKITPQQLSVEISDIGSHPQLVKEHTEKHIRDIVKAKQKGGMGLKLMHNIMDEVLYFADEERNLCLLTKKLD